MIKICDAEWVVSFLGYGTDWFWSASTNDIEIENIISGQYFDCREHAMYNFNEFAELNGITKWETEQ